MDNLYVLDWNSEVWRLIVRIVVAAIAGFAIGFERKTRSKEAGIRTHTIVATASCLMMILSKYAFADIPGNTDAARIAAQVVTGIGFLGAGMIVYRRDLLHGLTTAAGIWATAAIGMAFGAGMYVIGGCTTALIITLQIVLHLPLKAFKEHTDNLLKVRLYIDDNEDINKVKALFNVKKMLKFNVSSSADSRKVALIEITTTTNFTPEDLCKITTDNPSIIEIEKIEEF